MWLICCKGEIQELSSIWLISRFKNNKQVVAGVVRGLEAENKVCLMFLQGKRQPELNARRL